MKRLAVCLMFLAMMLALIPAGTASAATSANVTVNATPSYISITNAPNTWVLNGITGGGAISTNTVYYSSPLGDTTVPSATVADGECRFTVTNASTVAIDLTVTCSNFSGGDADMTNSDDGSNGATSYGAYCWNSGIIYASKVIMKTTGSSVMKNALAALTNIKWGAEIETQTDAWAGGSTSQATIIITATAD